MKIVALEEHFAPADVMQGWKSVCSIPAGLTWH